MVQWFDGVKQSRTLLVEEAIRSHFSHSTDKTLATRNFQTLWDGNPQITFIEFR